MVPNAVQLVTGTVPSDQLTGRVPLEGDPLGNVLVSVWREGVLLRLVATHNTWVKAGREGLRDLLFYPNVVSSGFTPDYIAIGGGPAAVADGQTALQGTEFFRKVITRRIPTESAGEVAGIWQVFIDTTEGNGAGSNDIYEVGLFDHPTAGLMFARATHAKITKSVSISLIYSWLLKITL